MVARVGFGFKALTSPYSCIMVRVIGEAGYVDRFGEENGGLGLGIPCSVLSRKRCFIPSYPLTYRLPLGVVFQKSFPFFSEASRRPNLTRKDKYAVNCAKLRPASYIIWVLWTLFLAAFNIPAMISSRSLRLRGFSQTSRSNTIN